MLKITIPAEERWDPIKERFVSMGKPVTIQLEHSLISIYKWEQLYHVPYLDKNRAKTDKELLDYIKCMTITPNVDPEVYDFLTNDNIKEIKAYIEDQHTATWFSDDRQEGAAKRRQDRVITSEIIYYWMISLQIPPEYAKWHINSLMTLIEVCSRENVKNSGQNKKMTKSDIAKRNRELNAQRRHQFNTRG